MTTARHPIDRLARRLAGAGGRRVRVAAAEVTEDTALDRRLFLRGAAAGALALSLGALPRSAQASTTVATACPGGSLAACNAYGWKVTNTSIAYCDKRFLGTPGGEAAAYECYVDALAARAQGMKECKSSCPKKKKPKSPKQPPSGDGGGGGSTTPPADSGPQPTCGFVDCATGDKCCPVQGGGVICCVVGCARSGDGCCSSSSDC